MFDRYQTIKSRWIAVALLSLVFEAWPVSARADGLKVVVFDIEPVGIDLTPEIKARLTFGSELLRKLLADRGLTIIDTAPQATKIRDNLPLSQCNGCDHDIANALGADIELTTAVQSTSAVIFSLPKTQTELRTLVDQAPKPRN